MTTATMTLLGELQRRGFTPHDSGEDWFDLPLGGSGVLSMPRAKVRAELDDGDVRVYVFTGNGILLWDARLSHNAPLNVVTAVVDLAIAYAVTMGADECE